MRIGQTVNVHIELCTKYTYTTVSKEYGQIRTVLSFMMHNMPCLGYKGVV